MGITVAAARGLVLVLGVTACALLAPTVHATTRTEPSYVALKTKPVAVSEPVLPVTSGPACYCPADHNRDGEVGVQDIFDFLTDWFAGAPNSDISGDGVVAVQDIFDFLTAWFAGCTDVVCPPACP